MPKKALFLTCHPIICCRIYEYFSVYKNFETSLPSDMDNITA
jgi:hypothetical protein